MGQEVTVETVTPAANPAPSASEPASMKLGFWKTAFLVALPILLLLYVFIAATGVYSQAKHRRASLDPVSVADKPAPNGRQLYIDNCAKCHGIRGNADGETSAFLDPWARKFGEEKFQFASTENGVPTDDDLIYVIAHGIPGTGMPPFDQLSHDEQRAIAGHVRLLAYAGLYAKLYQRAALDEDPFPNEIHDMTVKQLSPGAVREVPKELPAATPDSIERGRILFGTSCATCHGPMGAGDGPQVKDMKRDNGQPIKPRDLSRGIFMAGGEPERLYLRIALGIPGTPMPASSTLKPSEIGDLVNFVRSLSQNAPQ
jgi:cytochrome c oxidase cbb3-type subunit I/II